MEDELPRMKSLKRMYEDMLTEPTRPGMGHTTKAQDLADKMFEVEKKASGGYVKAADGCVQRGKTKGRMV